MNAVQNLVPTLRVGMHIGHGLAGMHSHAKRGNEVRTGTLFLLFAMLLLLSTRSFAQERPLVLTAMAPIHQLTLPLLSGTNIELRLVPEAARSMQSQLTVFTRQAERYAELFQQADAVIGIGKIWTGDPFYTAAREVNIRIVQIDASKPWSHELDGVAVANSPASQAVSPYFWLSPSNVIRVLDIVGSDLMRLYPDAATTIRANMDREKASYLQLKNAFEQGLLTATDPFVYALADEFIYLTSDLGIFVDGYFVKQDIDWTADDYSRLTSTLEAADVKVVIHKWEPTPEIQQAISAADATLVVLDTLETTTDFRAGLQSNLDKLLAAFALAQ